MPGVFITGTDTDVGKTVVSAGLAACLSLNYGQSVCAYKPLQTGSESDADMARLKALTKALCNGIETVCDVMLPVPASPWVSDFLAYSQKTTPQKTIIDPSALLQKARQLETQFDTLIVEGAGGLFVPITAAYDMVNLASDLKYPILLVARPDLGTINHTRLSLEAILKRNLPVLGVVVSAMPNAKQLAAYEFQQAIETLPEVFEKLLPVPVLAYLPDFGFHQPDRVFQASDLAYFEPIASAVLQAVQTKGYPVACKI
ncbi:MAG: dethiobiotin synthase [Vampirovibrionales bacterium]|nr:dethiobiotin synthase [Vampirovibrionales bacterium]